MERTAPVADVQAQSPQADLTQLRVLNLFDAFPQITQPKPKNGEVVTGSVWRILRLLEKRPSRNFNFQHIKLRLVVLAALDKPKGSVQAISSERRSLVRPSVVGVSSCSLASTTLRA